MIVAQWKVAITAKKHSNLTDADLDKILESTEWFESDLAEFVESKLPASLRESVEVTVSEL